QMAKQPAKLYYARLAESKMPLNPYYFSADVKSLSSQSDGVTIATFTNIRP
ncbi:N-acylglucosamine 2-epimerase, partial [Vibrio parahaemolyticus]|nr:N-acylglucosamine 2-epimerase [Vibrio parahaemolyticus]